MRSRLGYVTYNKTSEGRIIGDLRMRFGAMEYQCAKTDPTNTLKPQTWGNHVISLDIKRACKFTYILSQAPMLRLIGKLVCFANLVPSSHISQQFTVSLSIG